MQCPWGEGGIPYNDIRGEAPHKRGYLFCQKLIVHKRVRDWITPFLPHPVQCFDELGFFLFEAQDLIPLDVRFEGGYKVNNHGDLQDCTCVRMV